MAQFTFCNHAEPEMVTWQRWQDSGAPGELRPRRKLKYDYLGVTVFQPRAKDDDITPELARYYEPHWRKFTTRAPINYVRHMRMQGFLVYHTMLTLMRDYRKFEANTNYVRLCAMLPHRAMLMLEPYSFWTIDANGQADGLNPNPPHFEMIFDWIAKEVTCPWSFDVQVTDDWTNFPFEFGFEDRETAERFVFAWK